MTELVYGFKMASEKQNTNTLDIGIGTI